MTKTSTALKRPEPFLLQPSGKDYLWGGTRLKTEYGKSLPLTPLSETWECSAHPDGPSTAASGPWAGQSLPDVLAARPELLGCRYAASGKLPILIKLIDAEKDLSVQVHPDDAYAMAREGQPGKTELWYVVDALPGARLVRGFEHDMTPALLLDAVQRGDLEKHLHTAAVHSGDVFFIPPGTVHAIGAGCLSAEIQQSSNITYRLYDYNRRDKNGRLRPLHMERALDVLDLRRSSLDRPAPRLTRCRPGCSWRIIGRCGVFQAELLRLSGRCILAVGEESFQALLCVRGCGALEHGGGSLPLSAGECVFLPAGAGEVVLSGALECLRVRC